MIKNSQQFEENVRKRRGDFFTHTVETRVFLALGHVAH